jgi:hypothetical protein
MLQLVSAGRPSYWNRPRVAAAPARPGPPLSLDGVMEIEKPYLLFLGDAPGDLAAKGRFCA